MPTHGRTSTQGNSELRGHQVCAGRWIAGCEETLGSKVCSVADVRIALKIGDVAAGLFENVDAGRYIEVS